MDSRENLLLFHGRSQTSMSLLQKLLMRLRSSLLLCQGADVAKTDVAISFATANGCLDGSLSYAAGALQPATAEAMAGFLKVIPKRFRAAG